MKKIFALLVCLPHIVFAGEVFRIEVGKDYHNYTQPDLQRRVWELERAVWQLQKKVFMLEAENGQKPESWICTITAFGENYVGTGKTKALATLQATENCKAGRDGSSFFCKNPKCEQ